MKRTKNAYRVIRVAALLLLLSMVLGMVPASAVSVGGPVSVAGAAVNPTYTTETYVEWHRMIAVDGYNPYPPDIKGTYPILVMWKDGGTYYVANEGLTRRYYTGWWGDWWRAAGSNRWEDSGRKGYVPRPFDEDKWNTDTFVTRGDVTTWKAKFTGQPDRDNGGYPLVYFYMNENEMLDAESHWHTASAGTTGNIVENTIEIGDVIGFDWTWLLGGVIGVGIGLLSEAIKYATPRSYVRIFHNESGATDTWFSYYGDRVWGDKSRVSLSNLEFVVYWGEELKFTALGNTAVPAGAVMNIDDGVVLKDGCTLYISPGATVVLEGRFFNNGTIENHGTLVVKDGGCISTFMPESSGAGGIVCDGSKIDELDMLQKSIDENKAKMLATETELAEAQKNAELADENGFAAIRALEDYIATHEAQMEKVDQAKSVRQAADQKLQQIIGQIDDLNQQKEKHQEDLADLEEQLKQDRPGLTEAQIAKREKEIEKLQGRIDEVDKNLTRLDTERVTADSAYQDASKKYYEVAKDYEALDKAIGEAEDEILKRLAEVAELQDKVAAYKRNNDEIAALMDQMRKQGVDTVRSGEGNLVILPGGKVFLDKNSPFWVIKGGSVVCGGLLFCPGTEYPMVIANAKVEIRKGGVLLTGYEMTKNLSSLYKQEIQNADNITTLTIGANGSMAAIGGAKDSPLYVWDNSSFVEIDGFWKEASRSGLSLSSGVSEGQAYVASSKTWVLAG